MSTLLQKFGDPKIGSIVTTYRGGELAKGSDFVKTADYCGCILTPIGVPMQVQRTDLRKKKQRPRTNNAKSII